jgi:hypothetical protein
MGRPPFNGGGEESKCCGDSIPYRGGGQRCSAGGARPGFHVAVAVLLNGEDSKGGFHCLHFCIEEAKIG